MTKTDRENIFHTAIFWLSILGILTTVHLYIMNERGFDQGCFGFETSQQVEDTFDCESVIEDGFKFLGMSNIFWGFMHYASLTILGLISVLSLNRQKYKFIYIRNILIIFGFIYSAYLAYYQHFKLQEYCALCLVSGVISTFLLLLLAITKFNFNEPQNKQKLKKPYVIILILGFIIAGLDFYYFNVLNKKTIVVNEGKNDTELNGKNEIACEFNNKKPFVKIYMDLITDIDIQFGNPKSDNVIIEIFDPNCTHCKKLHLEMKKIIEQYENDVFIVIKPNPLWNYSIQQIQALYIANEYGKFDEMLTEQFARQKPRKGMDLNQLIEIAEIIGLDSQILKQRIKKADFLNHIIQENQKVKKSGITSAPTLLLNGYTIASKSRTTECIGELLD